MKDITRGYYTENGDIKLYLKDVVYGLEFTQIGGILSPEVSMDKEKVLNYLKNMGKDYQKITGEYISEEVFYKLSDLAPKNDRTRSYKTFICEELIPEFRRQWAFSINNKDNDELILAKALLISSRKIKKLENEVKILKGYKEDEIIKFNSEEDYKTFLRKNKNLFSMQQLAKGFRLSEEKLRDLLKEKKLIKAIEKKWILSEKYSGQDFIVRKIIRIEGKEDKKEVFWTLKGKEKIKELLKI